MNTIHHASYAVVSVMKPTPLSVNRYAHGRLTMVILAVVLILGGQNTVVADTPPSLRQHIEATTSDYPLSVLGIALKTELTLRSFYLNRDFALAWHDADGRPTQQALGIVAEIGNIAADGLLPSDYHYEMLRQHYVASAAKPGSTTVPSLEYDLLLSDAVVGLSQHLLAGKVDPETLSPEWKAQRRHKDLVTVLRDITQAEDASARINELRPKQVRYFRLQKRLARLRHAESPSWLTLAATPAIKPLTKDARLTAIRERLIYWGDLEETFFSEHSPEAAEKDSGVDTENPIYNPLLVAAVKNFQRRHGLEQDGIIGRATLEALNVSPAERAQQIVNNMEQWRWLAEDLGEKHVLVNIAAFELKLIENNQTIMRKPVIVGRDYRRTPVFSDKIRYLVLNPTWTAPMTLAVKDILPAVRKDSNYFSRLGFTVFDRNQNKVTPSTVDWNAITPRNFPYRLVQNPGPLNAMGQVKFMFPNQYDVYLHDTPSRDLFSKSERAFSSGCVRVSDPLDLAAWLLKDNGIDRNKIDDIVAKGELQTIFLKQPMPVHIEYWTAWIDSQEELHFRNDVYRRDPPLTAALATPLHPL